DAFRARVDVQRTVALAKKGRIGGDGDGRSRAVRADPFESSSVALEEVERVSDEDAADGRLAGPQHSAATGGQLHDAHLVGQRIDHSDLIVGRNDHLRRLHSVGRPDAFAAYQFDDVVVRDDDPARGGSDDLGLPKWSAGNQIGRAHV